MFPSCQIVIFSVENFDILWNVCRSLSAFMPIVGEYQSINKVELIQFSFTHRHDMNEIWFSVLVSYRT